MTERVRNRGLTTAGCWRARSGFTLLEVLIVLVVGLIVAVVAAIGINRALEASKVRNEARNVNELISAAQSLRSSNGFPGEMIGLLRNMRQLPPAFADPGGSYLLHAWNGSLTLRGTGDAGFELKMEGMPGSACTSLSALIAKSEHASVFIGNTKLENSGSGHLAARASDLCGAGPATTISLIYNS